MIKFAIDPAHSKVNMFGSDLTREIWNQKYRYRSEVSPEASMARVVKGVYKKDKNKQAASDALVAMSQGLWMPGGRILAGAGTANRVTLMNCYVDRTIDDSMIGIADALKDAMLTMQQGGGIGMDFSTLRPGGANLQSTGATASGPLPFIDMWDSMCKTIMSAGHRRGAMMATLADTHPDLPAFIEAKHTQGRLTNFNVSILVSDAFIDAVRYNATWELYFHVPPRDGRDLGTFQDEHGDTQYIYSEWDAAELWDLIVQSTYKYSEPGVIFIDRINDQNNLDYCETIRCTNPCGEQPLPPNAACNLGAINLARVVKFPFYPTAEVDEGLIEAVVATGVRFLDNVIDVTGYPLKAQEEEEIAKRRIGLGVSGLGDMLAQLGLRYGSSEGVAAARSVMKRIAVAAYRASAELSAERGCFPLFNEKFLERPFVKSLPKDIRDRIADTGIRNGVLLTIAPTGTTSIYYGNVSAGIEPAVALTTKRRVRQPDESMLELESVNYAYQLHQSMDIDGDPARVISTIETLDVDDHIRIQAACQEWIDASVSKTINCPESMTFEDFKHAYTLAYELGCKGCTTFRPSEVRGSIFTAGDAKTESTELVKRPEILSGVTYKINWPSLDSALYLTINHDDDGKPYEIFINGKSSKSDEWTKALTLMISALMRSGMSVDFIPGELKQVISSHDSTWIQGKYYGSMVAYLGHVLEKHLGLDEDDEKTGAIVELGNFHASSENPNQGAMCPKCGAPALIASEGCSSCTMCGYSSCV